MKTLLMTLAAAAMGLAVTGAPALAAGSCCATKKPATTQPAKACKCEKSASCKASCETCKCEDHCQKA